MGDKPGKHTKIDKEVATTKNSGFTTGHIKNPPDDYEGKHRPDSEDKDNGTSG